MRGHRERIVVYQADDTRLNRSVALKLIWETGEPDSLRKRFRQGPGLTYTRRGIDVNSMVATLHAEFQRLEKGQHMLLLEISNPVGQVSRKPPCRDRLSAGRPRPERRPPRE